MTDEQQYDQWAVNFHKFLFQISENDVYHNRDRATAIENVQKALHKTFDGLMLRTSRSDDAEMTFKDARALALHLLGGAAKGHLKQAYELGLKKNHDYGTNNILQYGVAGLIVRMNDKFSRLKNLYPFESEHTIPKVPDEKLRDTLLDIVNYATYALMLLSSVWS